MERERFERLVSEGIDALPARILRALDNVAVVAEDRPNAEQKKILKLRRRDALLGLYEGIPKTERGSGYGFVLPDKITIFQREIEDIARSEREIPKLVADTVWHEVAHYFGMNEEEVGEKRSKKIER